MRKEQRTNARHGRTAGPLREGNNRVVARHVARKESRGPSPQIPGWPCALDEGGLYRDEVGCLVEMQVDGRAVQGGLIDKIVQAAIRLLPAAKAVLGRDVSIAHVDAAR